MSGSLIYFVKCYPGDETPHRGLRRLTGASQQGFEMSEVQKALLLLSGGMDSTTLLWWMGAEGIPEIHTLSIDYGQRNSVELACAATLSKLSGARSHRCLKLDLGQIGGNPLTDLKVEVPTAAEGEQIRTVVQIGLELGVPYEQTHTCL